MSLEVVAIHGSSRRRGNSRRLLDELLEAAADARPDIHVELVEAYHVDVAPCIGCNVCQREEGGCARTDDDWHRIEGMLRAADVLVIASPIYFRGLPAPLKTLVDRLQGLWWLREKGGTVPENAGPFRRAAVVLTAAGKGSVLDPGRAEAVAAVNTLGFERVGTILAGGLEGADDASGRAGLLQEASELGRTLVS